ncbi:MAG: hypothetical protein VX278_08010, partial [Myxococcota bacterium]|nr:hypothetical protein [Myxococcota bacterium]
MYIPDSYEQALGWLCRSGDHPFCSDLDLLFRPPAMSFALAPFTLFMPAFIAVGIVAWLSASWSIQPLARGIRNVLGRDYMWAATFTLLGSWATLRLLMLADARIFVLLPLFWSWAISLSLKDSDRRMGILCGCLMGVATLTRPEVLLSSLFLIGALAWRIRWGVRWTTLGFLAPMGLWIGLLSQKAGRLVLGPRYWEGNLLAIWEWIPRREALRLYGMGLYSPEARTLATDPLTQSIQPDVLSGMGWFLSNAGTMVPPWVWIIGLGTIAYGIRQKKYRLHSVAALGLSAPYFAASFLPQARAPIFPQANFIPLYIVILIAFGV